MKIVTRTERGWPGHFICADLCLFRRNTLLECENIKIIVSTVGAMRNKEGYMEPIGYNRWYETMVFHAKQTGPYLDIDSRKDITDLRGPVSWGIWAETIKELPEGIDNAANQMHENMVEHFIELLSSGNLLEWKEQSEDLEDY